MERRLSVDAIIEKNNKIVLIKRGKEPFKGWLALPGGMLENNESVEDAVVREALEETSLEIEPAEILGVYSDPKRHPKGYVTVAFITKILKGELKAGSDAKEAGWFNLREVDFNRLAFDHAKIIKDFIRWKKEKRTYWSKR